ncbi:hypothetical protein [Methylocapsa palsarum]|uniref:Uncharacterized protein n=1 Tax=Methylocapsa palsarum TaxID=1612308 RepID=A0A1I4CRZ8_9HYPH|nr:hypothetical protein [Methylocapsa palsarum]SFK83685.1 hypothetical protein SAMN05444581_12731 [Methylocapsa palsarum]
MPNSTVPAVSRDLPSTRRAFLRSDAAARLDLTTGVNPELIAALAEVERSHLAFVKSIDRVGAAERKVRAVEDDESARKVLAIAEKAEIAASDKADEALERFASIRAVTLAEFQLKATLANTSEFVIEAQSIIADLLV